MARAVARVHTAHRQLEGGGFPVRRPFPGPTLSLIDPFLLLDEMGPVQWQPGEAIGAPDHPHRGFETVTYLLAGEMEHADSAGHRGVLRPGDVQWMTAGRGVVHSELPSAQLLRDGGVVHGFQIWVNLPASHKGVTPRYQEVPGKAIPEACGDGFTVRVIAGEAAGASAVVDTVTPILLWHVTLTPHGRFETPLPAAFNCLVYVFDGALRCSDVETRSGQLAELIHGDDTLALHNPHTEPAQALVLGGQPLNEPVARYGPFVMNTEVEIQQALADYRAGRLG